MVYKVTKPKSIYTLIILLGCFIGVGLIQCERLTINLTPSMKEGFYSKQRGQYGRGDIVSLCLVDPYKTIGLQRFYLAKGWHCGGTEPLVKQIIAVPGDNVVLSDNFIKVNGIKYFYKTAYLDSLGRPLNGYPRGIYSRTQSYWLIGTNDVKSWDSRYWGPVNKSQIITKLKPLLTW